MTDDFASWREALAGGKPGIHDGEPWCGYFMTRDNAATEKLARGRWPQVACAIWRENGDLKAERAGDVVQVERLWPYCAKRPIPYETYLYWKQHGQWPAEAA